MKKNLKYIVLALIGVAILAAWLLKKNSSKPEVKGNPSSVTQETSTKSIFSFEQKKEVDFKELASHNLPILIDYGSETCPPCQVMAADLKKFHEDTKEKAFVKFVNLTEYPLAANNVPVQVLPTQILFSRDGKPFVPSKQLAGRIPLMQYNSKDTGEHSFTVHHGILTYDQMQELLKEMGG